MKQRFLLSLTMLLLAVLGATAEVKGTHYTYDPTNYHARTVLYVTFVDANGRPVYDRSFLVGAFIGGDCRYEADQQEDVLIGDMQQPIYRLAVGGNTGDDGIGTSEMNQVIKLRVYRQDASGGDGGYEYLIEDDQFKFQGDYTYGEPSNPIKVTFDPIDYIAVGQDNYVTVHRGQPYDITSFVNNTEGKTLPVITWNLASGAEEYLTLVGTTLTGIKITIEREADVEWSCGNQQGVLHVWVDAPATNFAWNSDYFVAPLQGQLTLAVGDNDKLVDVLTNGYKLDPEDATTIFDLWGWESSNPDVIANRQGEFEVLSKGTAVLTGHANDGCGLEPTLTVTVEQPVNRITLKVTDVNAIVGSDITTLLANLMSMAVVAPQDADNKTLKWTVDGEYVVQQNNRYIAQKLTSPDSVAVIYLEATDGYGKAQPVAVTVNIIEPLPTALTAVRDPLGLMFAGNQEDVTEKLLNNIKVTPDSYTAKEMMEQQMLWLNIIEDSVDATGAAGGEHNVINYVDGKLYMVGAGTCSIQATAMVQTIDEIGQLNRSNLTVTYRVNVGNGLQEFVFDWLEMTTEETATITLHPNPADCEFDVQDVVLELVPGSNNDQEGAAMPETWKTIELTKTGDLQYSVRAYSLGSYSLRVLYKGEEKGWGGIDVKQRLHLKDGWQWIALQGQLEGEFEKAFGDQLGEARSETEMIINDSQLGYQGNLRSMRNDQTYKVKMNLDEQERVYDIDAYSYQYRMGAEAYEGEVGADAWSPRQWDLHTGWNWIGNPYQYYQNINDIFSKNSTFAEGDVVKMKKQFATYDGSAWTPAIYVEPGQGMILYKKEAGTVYYNSEYDMQQNTSAPVDVAAARAARSPQLWTIDDSRFDDNMVMVAYVGAMPDPTQVTLWAFVDGECRGRGVAVGDRQFVTIHGQQGERVTFKVYDQTTGELREVLGSRPFAAMSGTPKEPVALYAGKVVTAIDAVTAEAGAGNRVFDLQGRRVSGAQKGLYIKDGRKVVVR